TGERRGPARQVGARPVAPSRQRQCQLRALVAVARARRTGGRLRAGGVRWKLLAAGGRGCRRREPGVAEAANRRLPAAPYRRRPLRLPTLGAITGRSETGGARRGRGPATE